MDEQTWERLMMDEAMGALTPDVQALLVAHAKMRPGAEMQLSGWRRVAGVASEAMAGRAFPVGVAVPAARWWRLLKPMCSLAAAVLLGVGIGLRFRSGTERPQMAAAAAHVAEPAEPASSIGVKDFWSSQRLVAAAMQERHSTSPGRAWTWPAIQNETGDTQ